MLGMGFRTLLEIGHVQEQVGRSVTYDGRRQEYGGR